MQNNKFLPKETAIIREHITEIENLLNEGADANVVSSMATGLSNYIQGRIFAQAMNGAEDADIAPPRVPGDDA